MSLGGSTGVSIVSGSGFLGVGYMLGMIISYTVIWGLCHKPEHFRVCEVHVHPISSPSKRKTHHKCHGWFYAFIPRSTPKLICLDVFLLDDQAKKAVKCWLPSNANCKFQREKLGTLGREPEIYTNIWIIYGGKGNMGNNC